MKNEKNTQQPKDYTQEKKPPTSTGDTRKHPSPGYDETQPSSE